MTPLADGKAAINTMQGRLLVTMPARMSSETIRAVGAAVLDRLSAMPINAVILNMSMVESIDSSEFESLVQIVRVVKLMGRPAVFSGLQPGVVSALMDLGADADGIDAVRCIDDALALFGPRPEAAQPDEPAEAEGVCDDA